MSIKTFNELVEFVESKMRLSHIYQPLLIRSLIDAGGMATLRQLALSFLGQDESQIRYYEQRIKEMPLRILKKHGVVSQQGNLISLCVDSLTFEQRAQLKMLCEQRLQQFVQRRGLGLWDHRLLQTDPIPDSLRYQVLKAAGGRCALCGATRNEQVLDVDHIIPRSLGGKNTLENLQVLCAKCNRSKGNKDKTDFREAQEKLTVQSCAFCSIDVQSRAICKNGSVIAIEDKYPVADGHVLIIPLRHTPDFFSMTSQERRDAEDLIRYVRNEILSRDPEVAGFNLGSNCGEVAGQTILHAHIHLIPRRPGDHPNPRGGIRGAIPDKMAY